MEDKLKAIHTLSGISIQQIIEELNRSKMRGLTPLFINIPMNHMKIFGVCVNFINSDRLSICGAHKSAFTKRRKSRR